MAPFEQPLQLHHFSVEADYGFEAYDIFVPPPEQTEGAASEQIDIILVARARDIKQVRDKHVLGLLTTLRAVFPGNVTENIGRLILPYSKYDPVPDDLLLKLPPKEKRKV